MTIDQRHADRIAALVDPAAGTVAAGRHTAHRTDGLGVNLIPAPEPSPWRNPIVWASLAIITACAAIALAVLFMRGAGA